MNVLCDLLEVMQVCALTQTGTKDATNTNSFAYGVMIMMSMKTTTVGGGDDANADNNDVDDDDDG